MKQKFIRTVWGDKKSYEDHEMYSNNLDRLFEEYILAAKNPYLNKEQFDVYVLGEGNYKALTGLGFNCKLVDKNPRKYTHLKRMWLNKLYLLNHAMMDYDEIIYLDWDCQPVKNIPSKIWENLRQKDVIQAPLRHYGRGHNAPWRPGRWQKKVVPAGGFIYCRDKNAFSTMLTFENNPEMGTYWLDETYLAFYTDKLMGGWKNTDNVQTYFDRFEPYCAIETKKPVFPKKENTIFIHPCTNIT